MTTHTTSSEAERESPFPLHGGLRLLAAVKSGAVYVSRRPHTTPARPLVGVSFHHVHAIKPLAGQPTCILTGPEKVMARNKKRLMDEGGVAADDLQDQSRI